MEDRIALKIVTADGVVLERQVSYVSIPTPDGSVGILADHAPMLCAVGRGVIRCRYEGTQATTVSVQGGVAGIDDNKLVILAEEARMKE
ncbi:MAG: ATP synthase F1 subunit epsilon [Oscillospiraceae bacterium]|nr:ATP synthase F1 subunit epsilon [Oscillospiraceae bacterium]